MTQLQGLCPREVKNSSKKNQTLEELGWFECARPQSSSKEKVGNKDNVFGKIPTSKKKQSKGSGDMGASPDEARRLGHVPELSLVSRSKLCKEENQRESSNHHQTAR